MIKARRLASVATLTLALGAVAAFAVAGCEKEPGWKKHSFYVKDMTRANPEARLPRSLWDRITSLMNIKPPPGVEGKERKKDGPLNSVFAPLKVYLIEKNRGILQRGHTEIDLGPGGGEIDLADFVQRVERRKQSVGEETLFGDESSSVPEKSGSFYLAVEFVPDLLEAERKVYFLSGSVVRKFGHEILGSGCDTYFDVTTQFTKAMQGDGLLLNTTAGRHVSALAGTFFFAAAHEGKLYLATLGFKDSTAKRQLLCQR